MIWALLITGVIIGLLVRLLRTTFKSGYGMSEDLFDQPVYVKTCIHCHRKIPKDYQKSLCPHCGKLVE
jgi:Zn finger protein HypA/HybF involved in hydrogenase expression